MYATVVWWDLRESAQTIESLRAFLQEGAVERAAQIPGLRLKFWIADPDTDRWGAVFLWESEQAARAAAAQPNRAAELIGYRPTTHASFDVEGVVGGVQSVWGRT